MEQEMNTEQIKTLIDIARICLEHNESSKIIGRELGLSDEELDDLYASLAN
jgi:hypothetical protein